MSQVMRHPADGVGCVECGQKVGDVHFYRCSRYGLGRLVVGSDLLKPLAITSDVGEPEPESFAALKEQARAVKDLEPRFGNRTVEDEEPGEGDGAAHVVDGVLRDVEAIAADRDYWRNRCWQAGQLLMEAPVDITHRRYVRWSKERDHYWDRVAQDMRERG